jgi:hypothetical protein
MAINSAVQVWRFSVKSLGFGVDVLLEIQNDYRSIHRLKAATLSLPTTGFSIGAGLISSTSLL